MTDEHFGIGVVEMMSAGLFTVAHNSAGPKLDIVGGSNSRATGGLATTAREYADQILQVLKGWDSQVFYKFREEGKIKAKQKFGDHIFSEEFIKHLAKMKID